MLIKRGFGYIFNLNLSNILYHLRKCEELFMAEITNFFIYNIDILGIIILVAAFSPIIKLMRELPPGAMRKWWNVLIGGGFDLMTEGLSLQGQSEIPLVVYLCS